MLDKLNEVFVELHVDGDETAIVVKKDLIKGGLTKDELVGKNGLLGKRFYVCSIADIDDHFTIVLTELPKEAK